MDKRWMHKNMAKNMYPLKRKGKLSIDLFPYFYLPFRRYWCKRREEIKTLKDFSAVKEKKAGVTRTVFYALVRAAKNIPPQNARQTPVQNGVLGLEKQLQSFYFLYTLFVK